jgi:hypothetical protein
VGARGKGKILFVVFLALILLSCFEIWPCWNCIPLRTPRRLQRGGDPIVYSMLIEVFRRAGNWERAIEGGFSYSQVLMVSISVMHC